MVTYHLWFVNIQHFILGFYWVAFSNLSGDDMKTENVNSEDILSKPTELLLK